MDSWLAAAHIICPTDIAEHFARSTQSMRLMANAILRTEASTAHLDVLLGTAAELQTRIMQVTSTDNLTTAWNTLKSTLYLVTKHMKVSETTQHALVKDHQSSIPTDPLHCAYGSD
jgi:hypothetical protein